MLRSDAQRCESWGTISRLGLASERIGSQGENRLSLYEASEKAGELRVCKDKFGEDYTYL